MFFVGSFINNTYLRVRFVSEQLFVHERKNEESEECVRECDGSAFTLSNGLWHLTFFVCLIQIRM